MQAPRGTATGFPFVLQLFQAKLALEIVKIETSAPFRDGSLKSGLKTLGAAIHYQKAIDYFPVNDFGEPFPCPLISLTYADQCCCSIRIQHDVKYLALA